MRRKELRYLTVGLQDGFSGTAAVNDTLAAAATDMDVDGLDLHDDVTIIHKGVRFTTAGIATVRTVTASNNSQVWTVTINATGGTFTLTFNGETTGNIAFDATAGTVQTALIALATPVAGDIGVAGSAGGPYTITLAGAYANESGNTLTSSATGLTGGTSTAAVAAVQDGTDTWNITFTPAIATSSVPANDDVITFLPARVEMKIGEGNIEHTESAEPIIDTDRGLLDGVRAGSEQPMQVSASFVYNWLRASSGDAITVYEALNRLGDAAQWHNAASDPCEPYQVDIYVIDTPPCGSEQVEIIFFRRFNKQSLQASVEAASVTLSGICNATAPEIYRVANDANTIAAVA